MGLQSTTSKDLPPVQFTDVTETTGITFVHFKGNNGMSINREDFGPGVCVADFDGDGKGQAQVFRDVEADRFYLTEEGSDRLSVQKFSVSISPAASSH
jgi:hypothetical protein